MSLKVWQKSRTLNLPRCKKDLMGSTSFKDYMLQVTILENDLSGPFQLWQFMIQLDRSEGEKMEEEQESCRAVERRPHVGQWAQQSCTGAVTLFSSAIKPNPQTVLSCPAGTDQKYIYQIDLFSHIFNELTVSYPELKYGFGDIISFATQPTLCIWMTNGWSTGW